MSYQEGQIAAQESKILTNLLRLRETHVSVAMTPRTVVFSLPETVTVEEFFHKYEQRTFSRIPIYKNEPENIVGFVFRSDLLLAQARGNGANALSNYQHAITATLESTSLAHVFNELLTLRVHMMLVVDEYGGVEGIVTLEDVLETLIGLEIVDEKDEAVDMQKEAKRLWRRREEKRGGSIKKP